MKIQSDFDMLKLTKVSYSRSGRTCVYEVWEDRRTVSLCEDQTYVSPSIIQLNDHEHWKIKSSGTVKTGTANHGLNATGDPRSKSKSSDNVHLYVNILLSSLDELIYEMHQMSEAANLAHISLTTWITFFELSYIICKWKRMTAGYWIRCVSNIIVTPYLAG